MLRRSLLFSLILGAVIGGGYGAVRVQRVLERRQAIEEQDRVVIPPAQPISSSSSQSSPPSSSSSLSSSSVATSASDSLNLPVPFVVQAPFGNWDADHKEACEEASALMVLAYFGGERFSSEEEMDQDLIGLVRRNEEMGYAIDQTVEQVGEILRDRMPSLETTVLDDPSVEDVKDALRDGGLVIVPAAGRMLGNPYFQTPGPPYHMLVLRGFTGDGYAITNDPGTKRGEEFVYRWEVLMNAIHDWTGSQDTIEQGAKRVLVIRHPSP